MKLDYSKPIIAGKIKQFKQPGRDKRGPFYNGTQKWVFELNNIDLFKNAVWQGYLDASRTFRGIKDTKNNRKAFDRLANSIQSYFAGKNHLTMTNGVMIL